LENITYGIDASDQDPSTTARTVTLNTVTDNGGGADTNTDISETATISVGTVNDTPTLAASAANDTLTENTDTTSGAVFSTVTIDPIESGDDIASAQLTIGGGIENTDTVTINGTAITGLGSDSGGAIAGGHSYSYTQATGVVTITFAGSTNAAAAELVLENITYGIDASDQDPSTTARTVTLNTVTDNGGGADTNTDISETATISVGTVNDTPIIGGSSTGVVTEDIDPDLDALLETTGSLTVTDPDLGESSFSAGTIVGTYGNLAIDVSGNWSYAADNPQAAIQQLDVGESVNDVLTVTTADGTTHDITITISGAEDAPVITATSTGTVAEDDTLTANGTFSISDVDSNDNPISFPDEGSTLGDNGFGNFVLSGSTWTYTLNTAHASVQALDAGQSLTDSHTFIASDGSSQLVTVTINGAEEVPIIDDGGIDTETEDETDKVSDQVQDETDASEVLEEETSEDRPIYSDDESVAEDLAWEEEPDVFGGEPVALPPLDDAALVNILADVRQNSDPNGDNLVAHTPIPPKFIDLNHLDIAPFELENPDMNDMESMSDNDSFVNSLEELDYSLDEAIKEEENRSRIEVESAIGIVLSLSAGFVSWVLRAGSLLASFVSVIPLWRQFDPLPILDIKGKKHRATNEDQKDAEKVEENTAVENIFDDEKSD
ncbi:MAG: hypothetical protein GY807_13785, partial [Gammaproteobacteria bacterium]|nr:hypothetical protein [Gammaproteobacteria bacterium]